MTHSVSYVLGFLLGVFVAVAAALLIYWLIKRKTGKDVWKYDERQELARGKAFKAAYFVLLGYLLVYGLFSLATGIEWCDTFTGVIIGACISAAVFAIVCIFNDAYISFRQNPKFITLLFGLLGLFNLLIGIFRGINEGFVKDGMLNNQITNIVVGSMLLILLVIYLIKLALDKRKAGEQNEES